MSGEAAPSFPWEEVMAACLGRLRWSPGDFWRATPREIAAALRGLAGPVPAGAPSRSDLDRLMRRFPDRHEPETEKNRHDRRSDAAPR